MDQQTFSSYSTFCFEKNLGLTPTAEQVEKLYKLTELMLETNRSMNLTAIKDEKSVILKHYVDSMTISDLIPMGAKVADIGTGAGFPSLPLGIFREDLKILGVDSTAKRIEYVKRTAKALGLEGVNAISARAEELSASKEYRESFDVCTARAVASLPILIELCLPLVKIGGIFIAMKAAKGDEELSAAENSIRLCGGELIRKKTKELIGADGDSDIRRIYVIKKISTTPTCYPRQYGKILKKPL